MRRVRYQVAMSLDGYIAGPQGEADWILRDPDIDFNALFNEFDTFLIGRRTFEAMAGYGQGGGMPGKKSYVFSRTLQPSDCPGATLVADDFVETVTRLREEPGKDIWLFGGGELFRSLLAAGLVDTVEVAVIPVLLGGGIPLLPSPSQRAHLTLTGHRIYNKTGIVLLQYAVQPAGAKPRARSRKKPKAR
jgi:dihydrofolate reductase